MCTQLAGCHGLVAGDGGPRNQIKKRNNPTAHAYSS